MPLLSSRSVAVRDAHRALNVPWRICGRTCRGPRGPDDVLTRRGRPAGERAALATRAYPGGDKGRVPVDALCPPPRAHWRRAPGGRAAGRTGVALCGAPRSPFAAMFVNVSGCAVPLGLATSALRSCAIGSCAPASPPDIVPLLQVPSRRRVATRSRGGTCATPGVGRNLRLHLMRAWLGVTWREKTGQPRGRSNPLAAGSCFGCASSTQAGTVCHVL